MPNPFEYSKSILNSKQYMDDVSGFVPFLMNKLFSAHPEMIVLANIANGMGASKLSKRAIYDFYFYTVPQTKRWLKYPKNPAEIQTTKYIMDYFGIREEVAKDYLILLSKEEIKEIIDYFEKRGVINGNKKTKKVK